PHLGSSTVARRRDDGAMILFHLRPDGRIVGATGLGTVGSIGRDIRLAQALIAARAHPDRAVLMDSSARLKSLLDRMPGASLPPVAGAVASEARGA
ncbi:MAG: oxidoreductase C-terminal domain-containing protein, partial [Bauldia litoralis]